MASIKEGNTFIFTWKIINFSSCAQMIGEELRSPDFKVDFFEDSTWFLSLYPRGCKKEEGGAYLSCYLNKSKEKVGAKKVELELRLEVISFSGFAVETKTLKGEFSKSSLNALGWDKFLDRKVGKKSSNQNIISNSLKDLSATLNATKIDPSASTYYSTTSLSTLPVTSLITTSALGSESLFSFSACKLKSSFSPQKSRALKKPNRSIHPKSGVTVGMPSWTSSFTFSPAASVPFANKCLPLSTTHLCSTSQTTAVKSSILSPTVLQKSKSTLFEFTGSFKPSVPLKSCNPIISDYSKLTVSLPQVTALSFPAIDSLTTKMLPPTTSKPSDANYDTDKKDYLPEEESDLFDVEILDLLQHDTDPSPAVSGNIVTAT